MPGDPTATTPPTDFVPFGRLGRPFRLEGGLRLQPAPGVDVERLREGDELFVEGHGRARIRALAASPSGIVVHLEGVRDRDAAAALVHARVFASAATVTVRPEAELAGAAVLRDGETVGEVVEVVLGGANELLRVRTRAGEAWLPLAAPYVRLEGGRVVLVDPPEGLLEPS